MSLVGLLSHYLLRLLTDRLFVLLVVRGAAFMRMLASSSYLIFFLISVAEAAPLMGLACVLQRFYRSTRFRLTPSLRRYSETETVLPVSALCGRGLRVVLY